MEESLVQVLRARETRHDVSCELRREIVFLNFVLEQEHSVLIQVRESEEFFQTCSCPDVRCPSSQVWVFFVVVVFVNVKNIKQPQICYDFKDIFMKTYIL